jgi:hypothetical protein
LEHAVEDSPASGWRLVLENYSLLQKRIRFKRLVGALLSDPSTLD